MRAQRLDAQLLTRTVTLPLAMIQVPVGSAAHAGMLIPKLIIKMTSAENRGFIAEDP